jgi:hypothetical protein
MKSTVDLLLLLLYGRFFHTFKGIPDYQFGEFGDLMGYRDMHSLCILKNMNKEAPRCTSAQGRKQVFNSQVLQHDS